MKSSKPIIAAVVVTVLTPLLLLFLFVGLKRLEKLPFKPSYHDPIFDKVMPKDYSLADLKASMARQEPLVTNPTEEDIAIMKADIDEFRKRYEANDICNDWVNTMFRFKYDYHNKYRESIKPLIEELAAKDDMFALSLSLLRDKKDASEEAARKGELNNLASQGWFEATGFNRPMNSALGEKYLKEAAERGSYKGNMFLVGYYYRYKHLDKLCVATKNAYERYGLEIFYYEIHRNTAMLEYIQNNCHIFSDKDYTSEEMKFDYLKDIDTAESRLVQGFVMSNTGRYTEAKAVFEALENHEDQKIRANAQLCLSRMYYFGGGVAKDEYLADLYRKKAFDNGSYGAVAYKESDKGYPYTQLPKQLLRTDYGCIYGNCYQTID
jgi:hypothetical protein